ncbi:PD-(D/E)XK motif protein [Psychrobacillus sp. NEAU-3TGS]|uniref:PD-(D/E)XK motif protein n=1 Tax=Psychrobacillus sp. NEAU-3TGS TaxID=2995412 RepID=UPI002496B10B|nr:PD-(D/E)XK motif protein [Psychrobacillus sp. NEAU-3TGS]MDI2587256.1 PD-(D/E)XK motif protein [Psychrobacillus sp. NEAU-3TGS]
METIQKIRDGFAYFRTIEKSSITLKEQFYWIVKIDGMQGVAIEISADKHVNEQFASISYYTKEYILGSEERHLLMLVSNHPKLYDDFAIICAGFLEKVLDAETYQEILMNPISWWHSMKELIGNANIEKATYSVLAEMLSYYYLLKQEKEASWVGPFGGSVDIDCDDGYYEVKSTIARYGSQITINSQYQLQANYLLFYRFEPAMYGISINDMITKLVELDVAETEIQRALEKLKYPVGSEVRTKSYRLLEVKKYEIDESFPKIVPESFIDGQLSQHISGLTYKLDLDGLNGEIIDLKEFQEK